MYENTKLEVIKTALEVKNYGLIALAGGNVSIRMPNGDICVTPSGTYYETMTADDVLVLNAEGDVIEGILKPSVDTIALLYIYKHMPEVGAIIHTHQVYATAVGLIADRLPSCVTTLANAALGEINVAPFTGAATEEMGIESVRHLGGKRAVILKHHGVITVGSTLKEALYAAVYTEEAAKTYLVARAATQGEVSLLTQQQTDEAVECFKSCGQGH